MPISVAFNIITGQTDRSCETREIELGPVTHVRWMQGSRAFNLVSQSGREYLVSEDADSIAAKFRAAGIETLTLKDAEKDENPMIIPTHQIVAKKCDGRFTTIWVGVAPSRSLLARGNPLNLGIQPG